MIIIIIYCFRNNVRDVVAEYLTCDKLLIPASRFKSNILKTMRHVKKRALIFWIVIMSNGFVYVIKPLIIPGRHLPDDEFILLGELLKNEPLHNFFYIIFFYLHVISRK